ncbi:MAG: acyl transferase [Bacteroidetes bacterium]|nr:acyl transferase [Bacteroidota bacterium]
MQNLIQQIFNTTTANFNNVASEVFAFQYQNNLVYKQWTNALQLNVNFKDQLLKTNHSIQDYPFLPISFFKTHQVVCNDSMPQQIFESSGTTQTINSKHLIKDINLYKTSFINAFEMVYGGVQNWCIIGLLPSYLERSNSSLVFMVDALVKQSKNDNSGFYLYDFDKLHQTLLRLELQQQKTLVIGVTFALLDFAEQFNMNLKHTVIMETGGMKGRKKEMTKDEIHQLLKQELGVDEIHSEYGMTELLSQAYSTRNQIHTCPPWMKVVVRDEEDPLLIKTTGKGVLNVIDLANVYSCSFIATDDVGEVFEDGRFKVFGRLDNSDLRGCSLLWA